MERWLRIAFSPRVVLRGLMYAAVVGLVLVGINHGDVILDGALTPAHWLKIGLTVLVPYCVSVLSSVGALLEAGVVDPERAAERDVG